MQVIITFSDNTTKTISYEEWESIGRQKGYCKANKIYEYQIIGIELLNQIINK